MLGDQRQRLLGIKARHQHQHLGLLNRLLGEGGWRAVVQRRGHHGPNTGCNTPGDAAQLAHALGHLRTQLRRRRQTHNALGPPGSTRGVGHMSTRCTFGAVIGRLLRQPALVVTGVISNRIDYQHLHPCRYRITQGGQQVRLDDQHLGRRVVQQIRHLIGLEVPVDRAVKAAGALAALNGIDKRRAVAQHHCDHIAIFNAKTRQATGQPQRAVGHLITAAAQLATDELCSH